MASKSKVSRQAQSKVDKNFDKKLLAIPLIALVIKLITMSNIPGQVDYVVKCTLRRMARSRWRKLLDWRGWAIGRRIIL